MDLDRILCRKFNFEKSVAQEMGFEEDFLISIRYVKSASGEIPAYVPHGSLLNQAMDMAGLDKEPPQIYQQKPFVLQPQYALPLQVVQYQDQKVFQPNEVQQLFQPYEVQSHPQLQQLHVQEGHQNHLQIVQYQEQEYQPVQQQQYGVVVEQQSPQDQQSLQNVKVQVVDSIGSFELQPGLPSDNGGLIIFPLDNVKPTLTEEMKKELKKKHEEEEERVAVEKKSGPCETLEEKVLHDHDYNIKPKPSNLSAEAIDQVSVDQIQNLLDAVSAMDSPAHISPMPACQIQKLNTSPELRSNSPSSESSTEPGILVEVNKEIFFSSFFFFMKMKFFS